jgi:hypothetical protein
MGLPDLTGGASISFAWVRTRKEKRLCKRARAEKEEEEVIGFRMWLGKGEYSFFVNIFISNLIVRTPFCRLQVYDKFLALKIVNKYVMD